MVLHILYGTELESNPDHLGVECSHHRAIPYCTRHVIFSAANKPECTFPFICCCVFQECTQPISLYRSLKWWNMVPIGVKWFLTRTGPCATAHLEAGGFIRSKEGLSHPNIQYHFLPSAFKDHGRVTVEKEAFQVSTWFTGKHV